MKDKRLEERLNVVGRFSEIYERLREDEKVPIGFKRYVTSKLTSHMWLDDTNYFTRLTSYEHDERTNTVTYRALEFQTGYCSDRGEVHIIGNFKPGSKPREKRWKISAEEVQKREIMRDNPMM